MVMLLTSRKIEKGFVQLSRDDLIIAIQTEINQL